MPTLVFLLIVVGITIVAVKDGKTALNGIINSQASQLSTYRKTIKQQSKHISVLENKECPVFDKSPHLLSQEEGTTYGTGY